ncbi:hypothetical protein Tco_1574746, partial [Tanacetum coccineum]
MPLDRRVNEAVHKEGGDSVERAITTYASLVVTRNHGGAPAQTRSERVLEKPNEPPLPEGHTSRSGEGSMEHIFELTNNVLALEKEKDAQAVEILKLKKRVKKLERKMNSSISHPRRRIYKQVESSDDDLDKEDASMEDDFDVLNDTMEDVDATPVTRPITTTVFDDDEDLTIAQTLVKMRSEKAKEKGVAFRDETESVEMTKNKVQGDAHIELDAEVALRIQAELDKELRVERERQEEASKVTIAKMFDEVQARMNADYELAARMTQKEQEKYTIEERARLLAE